MIRVSVATSVTARALYSHKGTGYEISHNLLGGGNQSIIKPFNQPVSQSVNQSEFR